MSEAPNKIIYSMIGVSKYYDKRPVLEDISLSYFYGAKIGVLGLNGSGKTSLLRILAGVDKEFAGQTIISPGLTVGLLEQEPRLDESKTVREVVEEGVQDTVRLMEEFNRINEQLSQPMSDEEMSKVLDRQASIQEKLDALDAWDLDSRLEMAMDALRCPPGTCRSRCSPAASAGVWPCAGCCCRSRTSCSWTNPPTIWMPRPWPGWSTTSSNMPAR